MPSIVCRHICPQCLGLIANTRPAFWDDSAETGPPSAAGASSPSS
ncbi:hypothetical protein [Amycolatopsis anabasis]|nr:hypothetical protein [Amycolatopsis anabasis]